MPDRAVTLYIYGDPVPKERPRVTRHGTYTPQKTKDYEALVQKAWFAAGARSFRAGTPVRISVFAYFALPQSMSKKKRQQLHLTPHVKHRADVDNLAKAVLDALNGVAYPDDCAVYSLTVHKVNTMNEGFCSVTIFGEEEDST